MSPTCSCTGSYILVAGVRYSKHFEPSHYSRINKGKKKAKVKPKKEQPASPFSADTTDAEQKSLEVAIAKALKSGAVTGGKA